MDRERRRHHALQITRNAVHALVARALALTGIALFPADCAGCGRAGDWFCDDCWRLVNRATTLGCRRCGRAGAPAPVCAFCLKRLPGVLRRLRAAWTFRTPIRESIYRFKYRGEYERGRDLGRRMAAFASELEVDGTSVDLVVPVPLHPRRLRERGFNQALVLAHEIAPVFDARVLSAVDRVRYTRSQTGLDESERAANMRDAFRVADEFRAIVEDTAVIIVDDVITTGATVGAVASELANAGVREVRAIAVAR